LTAVFTGASGGAFRRITPDPSAHVSLFLYKAALEVTEAGTMAAAAAAAVISLCVPPPRRAVVFDRPFGVVLRHRPTGVLLFVGVVADPELACRGLARPTRRLRCCGPTRGGGGAGGIRVGDAATTWTRTTEHACGRTFVAGLPVGSSHCAAAAVVTAARACR